MPSNPKKMDHQHVPLETFGWSLVKTINVCFDCEYMHNTHVLVIPNGAHPQLKMHDACYEAPFLQICNIVLQTTWYFNTNTTLQPCACSKYVSY